MRTMLRILLPTQRANQADRDGSLPRAVGAFLERYKPEAAYFCPDGKRSAWFVFDLPDPSDMAVIAGQFFHELEAEVSFSPVMNADELRAGLARAAR
jgi:hypothetical protein